MDLCPDYGAPWGLWSNHPLIEPARGRLLTPDDFLLGNAVTIPLREWLDTWNRNFSTEPGGNPHKWRIGFDIKEWLQQGDQISSMIEDELPEYYVHRTYWTYLDDPSGAPRTARETHSLQRKSADGPGTHPPPLRTKRQQGLVLYPDYGSMWGLRFDRDSTAGLSPSGLDLSDDVTTLLRGWLDVLNSNFADVPRAERQTWKKGFNVRGWARLGDQICSMIEDELPEHYVHRLYWSYTSLYRNYRMNPTTRDSFINEQKKARPRPRIEPASPIHTEPTSPRGR